MVRIVTRPHPSPRYECTVDPIRVAGSFHQTYRRIMADTITVFESGHEFRNLAETHLMSSSNQIGVTLGYDRGSSDPHDHDFRTLLEQRISRTLSV